MTNLVSPTYALFQRSMAAKAQPSSQGSVPANVIVSSMETRAAGRVLIISLFGLTCKKRNVLGSKRCFGATAWCCPQEAWQPSAFGFLKALNCGPFPSTRTCPSEVRGTLPSEHFSDQSSGITGFAQWCLQPDSMYGLSQQ